MTLVLLDPDRCPSCAQPVEVETVGQPALFLHGGYGATRVTTIRYCPCGWVLTGQILLTRPDRRT